jgi:arsenate reductase (thioredoxin)
MIFMSKKKVLFVCIHNSARSQMAEAWMNHFCGDIFEAHSAGLEPGVLNPLVVEVMKEAGIDISSKTTQGVFELYKRGESFDYVIAVCDGASAEQCPIFPGLAKRLHWNFPDPSKTAGTKEEKLIQIREVRDAIKSRIENWCSSVCVTK